MTTRQQRASKQTLERVAQRKRVIRAIVFVKLELVDSTPEVRVAEFVDLCSTITRDVNRAFDLQGLIGMADVAVKIGLQDSAIVAQFGRLPVVGETHGTLNCVELVGSQGLRFC